MRDKLQYAHLVRAIRDADAASLRDTILVKNSSRFVRVIWSDTVTRVALLFLFGMVAMAVVAPAITPYEYDERVWSDEGDLLRGEPPSLAHPLGTTDTGYDILSRVMFGARPTLLVGFLGGITIISIGTLVGVTAGYVGGYVENILMRLTDFWYIIPFIPFAIVVITLFGIGFVTSILLIGLVLWRGSARVLRSQVLQIKERPFVVSAKATGASVPYIIYKHVLPNIGSMIVLFFAFGTGNSILAYSGLAFLGVSDPFIPDWGIMIRNAYRSGGLASNWWWAVAPGLCISLTVLAVYLLGRRYEIIISGEYDRGMKGVTEQ